MDAITWTPDPALTDTSIYVPPTPKPRRESVSAWSNRLAKSIKSFDDRCQRVIGRGFGDNYRIVATDGHRALCTLDPSAEPLPIGAASTDGDAHVSVGDSLFLAVKRAKAVTAGRRVKSVHLSICDGRLYVTVPDFDGVGSCEFVDVDKGAAQSSAFVLSIDYLLPVFGRPIVMSYRPNHDDRAIKFTTTDLAWRYVVMPMRP